MKAIAVFCGSSVGNDPGFVTAARELGKILVQKNITLIYGGSKIGIMGVVAHSVLESGGKVIGIIPHFLTHKEIVHNQLTELIIVETMHERKMKMAERCDGVIALPGGFGTLDEFFEMLTWGQLGLHKKPVAMLNVNGFFDNIILQFERMEKDALLKPENKNMIITGTEPTELLDKMENYQPPEVIKWLREGNV
jgi:uncharacterized protein (TIGR00730 family)